MARSGQFAGWHSLFILSAVAKGPWKPRRSRGTPVYPDEASSPWRGRARANGLTLRFRRDRKLFQGPDQNRRQTDPLPTDLPRSQSLRHGLCSTVESRFLPVPKLWHPGMPSFEFRRSAFTPAGRPNLPFPLDLSPSLAPAPEVRQRLAQGVSPGVPLPASKFSPSPLGAAQGCCPGPCPRPPGPSPCGRVVVFCFPFFGVFVSARVDLPLDAP